jgi:hypothetical protein
MLKDVIIRHMRSNNVEKLGDSDTHNESIKDFLIVSTMGYYETYSLFAMTKRNVTLLDEDILKNMKFHKKKIFFNITYSEIKDEFSLLGIVYYAPLSKCIKIINAIIKMFNERNVRTDKIVGYDYVVVTVSSFYF